MGQGETGRQVGRLDRDAPDMTVSADPPPPSVGDSASDQTEQDQIWVKGYGIGLSTGMMVGAGLTWLRERLRK